VAERGAGVVLGGRAAGEPQAAGLAARRHGIQTAGARRHSVTLVQLLQGYFTTRASEQNGKSIYISSSQKFKDIS
jgi:hypothetical protein